MIQHLAAILAALQPHPVPPRVAVSNRTLYSEPGGGIDGKCEYQLTATGIVSTRTSSDSSPFTFREYWLKSGAASDYEVECVVSGPDAADVVGTTQGVGVWSSLGSARLWTLTDTSIVGGAKEASLRLNLRDAVTLEPLDSADISMTSLRSN